MDGTKARRESLVSLSHSFDPHLNYRGSVSWFLSVMIPLGVHSWEELQWLPLDGCNTLCFLIWKAVFFIHTLLPVFTNEETEAWNSFLPKAVWLVSAKSGLEPRTGSRSIF